MHSLKSRAVKLQNLSLAAMLAKQSRWANVWKKLPRQHRISPWLSAELLLLPWCFTQSLVNFSRATVRRRSTERHWSSVKRIIVFRTRWVSRSKDMVKKVHDDDAIMLHIKSTCEIIVNSCDFRSIFKASGAKRLFIVKWERWASGRV